MRATACVPRHTHRQRRAHRPGFTNPDRCETSFHRSRIDAARAAPLRWAASRRMRGLLLRTPKMKRPRGQASQGRSLSLGRSACRPPSQSRIRSCARA